MHLHCCIYPFISTAVSAVEGRGLGSLPNFVHGCACRTSKIHHSLYLKKQFLDPSIYHFLLKNTQFRPNWVLFWQNLPKYTQFANWVYGSVMETHPLIYQISWKYTQKGRHVYVYTSIYWVPPGTLCPNLTLDVMSHAIDCVFRCE